MNSSYRPFRVLRKKDTKVMYVAIPDLLQHFESHREGCKSPNEGAIWQGLLNNFQKILYESLDHDL